MNTTQLQTAVLLTEMAENAVRTTRVNEELSVFARAIREGRKSRRSRLQMSLVLNNRRRVLNLVCLLFLLAIGFLQDSFILYSEKHDSQDATELPAFQPTTLVFKYGTPHTEVVYSLQASIISCPRGKRNTYLLAPPAIFSQKIKTSCMRMTKIVNVQNSG